MFHRTGASIAAIPAVAALALLRPWCASGAETVAAASVTLEERWDSNVNFTSEDSGSDSDFITTASPRMAVSKRGERYGLNAFYRLDANYHTQNPDLDYLGHGAGLDAGMDLTKRMKVAAGDRFAYSKDSLQAAPSGILVRRTPITSNTAFFDIGRQMTKSADLSLNLTDGMTRYKDPGLIDGRTDSAALTARYVYDHQARAKVSYIFTNYHFDSTERDRDIETHTFRIGVAEQVSPNTSADVEAGVVYAPEVDGNLFLTASGALMRAFKDSVLKLIYTRDITSPTGLTDEININDSIGFEWLHGAGRQVSFTVFGDIARNRTEPSGRVDINSYNAGVTGTWSPNRRTIVAAGLSHFQQWPGDDLGSGLTRNQVFIKVTFTSGERRF